MSLANVSISVRELPTVVHIYDNGLTAIPLVQGSSSFLFDRPADARAWLEAALAALERAEREARP